MSKGWGGGGKPVQTTGSARLEGGLGPKYAACVSVFFGGIIIFYYTH